MGFGQGAGPVRPVDLNRLGGDHLHQVVEVVEVVEVGD